jgi:small subunit ribosomal protein S7
MSRRGQAPKREVLPDPIYNSELVSRFINKIMLKGKRGVAQKIFYGALEEAANKAGKDPMELLETAIKNAMPMLETRPRRVGGSTYQVPMEVRPERRQTLALRWLVQFARARGERGMQAKLAAELLDAANNTGATIKKREEVHKMAEANKPFAHYRW